MQEGLGNARRRARRPRTPNLLSTNHDHDEQQVPISSFSSERGFIERMSEYAIINSTLDHISRYRNQSRLLDLGASTMEASVRLVRGHLEPHLRSLDHYAGRQLERLESGYAFIADAPRSVWATFSAGEVLARLEQTLLGLRNYEAYIGFLIERLRRAASDVRSSFNHNQQQQQQRQQGWCEDEDKDQTEQAELRAHRVRETVSREIVLTMRKVVRLVNTDGSFLPVVGQEALKQFLLTLPNRFSESLIISSPSSKIFMIGNEAIVLIKSITNILSRYLYPTTSYNHDTQQ